VLIRNVPEGGYKGIYTQKLLKIGLNNLHSRNTWL